MTLSELKGLATVGNGQRFSEERERAKELLVDAVLTYVADIEEAERGATPRQVSDYSAGGGWIGRESRYGV